MFAGQEVVYRFHETRPPGGVGGPGNGSVEFLEKELFQSGCPQQPSLSFPVVAAEFGQEGVNGALEVFGLRELVEVLVGVRWDAATSLITGRMTGREAVNVEVRCYDDYVVAVAEAKN